jgi:hypothetical protein
MDTQTLLLSIQHEISLIKTALSLGSLSKTVSDKWIPRTEVMKFFNYAPTQMAALEKSEELIVAKVGKRKFILKESISNLLDKHRESNSAPTNTTYNKSL